jgi:predicted DCC family thiol-disulfide oxidoreductase YuxK
LCKGAAGTVRVAKMARLDGGKEKGTATLIFDGACPICAGTVKWIGESEFEGSFELLPCQAESLNERFPGIRRVECMRAMQLVLPDGRVLAGEKALPEIFARLKAYRVFAPLFKMPGAGVIARVAYRWFADRRYRIAAFVTHMRGGGKTAM